MGFTVLVLATPPPLDRGIIKDPPPIISSLNVYL